MAKFNESQYAAMRTAFLTAYPKIFTDINYSIDIFSNMKNLAAKNKFSFNFEHFSNQMSIEVEARHKALNSELKKNLTKNSLVIEIAAGLSPRRLEFKDYAYAELDFKPVMDVKKEIYKSLGFSIFNKNLYDVDLTNLSELNKCLTSATKNKTFDKIIIVNEGLFWYLSKQDIENMTIEIKKALNAFNWIWITSDCPPSEINNDEYRNTISKSAKVKRGTFADYKDFTSFFENLGLKNTRFKLLDCIKIKDISSAKFFSVDEDRTTEKLNAYTDISILKRP